MSGQATGTVQNTPIVFRWGYHREDFNTGIQLEQRFAMQASRICSSGIICSEQCCGKAAWRLPTTQIWGHNAGNQGPELGRSGVPTAHHQTIANAMERRIPRKWRSLRIMRPQWSKSSRIWAGARPPGGLGEDRLHFTVESFPSCA